MRAFAEVSGDRNPMHSDAMRAHAAGFQGPIVYGGLILAKISELLGMDLPGPGCVWVKVDLSFVGALYVGEVATLEATVTHVSTAVNLITIKHVLRAAGRVIARGTSEVRAHG